MVRSAFGKRRRSFRALRGFACAGLFAWAFGAANPATAEPLQTLAPFLKQYCFECHGPDKQKGEIRFDSLGTDLTKHENLEIWQGVLDQLNLGEMPPPKKPQPERARVEEVAALLTERLKLAYERQRSTGGHTVLRRLNRHELRNTFRDLLYLRGPDYRPDAAGSRLVDNNGNGSVERTGSDPLRFFPEDEEEDGFFNVGDKLVMSDFFLKLAMGAAEEVLAQATHLGPKPEVEAVKLAGGAISKPRGNSPEFFAEELFPEVDSIYWNLPFRPEVIGRGVPVSAKYRITLQASAHNAKHPYGEMLRTNQAEPFRIGLRLVKGRDNYPVQLWEIPADGKTRTLSATVWMDKQWAPELCWENGPTDREMRADLLMQKYFPDQFRKAPDRKEIPDKKAYDQARADWTRDMAVSLLKDYKGPHLRLRGLTVEPIVEQWPPRSHLALYGTGSGKEEEIRNLLTTFARRAFRRPVTPEEIEPYVQLVLRQKVEPVVELPPGIKDLSYRLYLGKWTKLPDFSTLTPETQAKLPKGYVDIKISGRKDYFAMLFEGKLDVPEDGEYLFEMASDDGGRILVDGQRILDHDGLHGAELKKAKVKLKKGERPIRIEYLAYGQPNSFRAGWSGPGAAHVRLTSEALHNPAPNQTKNKDAVPRYHRAMQDGYAAILCSPQFLYLKESGDKLDPHALASRLSYFLWSSMPDDTLARLADSGKITEPETRRREVERMLKDPKSAAFVRHFTSTWLRLDKLGKMPPSGGDYQFYKNLRVEPMLLKQATTYFEEILRTNAPVERFIDSDYTYANHVLGKWIYRREEIRGNQLRKVKLEDPRLGGIFTLPGVMTATANGVDTSPVVRGAWLLENVLGTPPAPPPPDVEPLPTDTREATTIREQLALHRKNEACNSCHRKIDPLGFAFENFDVVGRWRDKYKRARDPIDASATLSNGKTIRDVVALKQHLKERKELIVRSLAQKLLVYATGRRLETADRGEIDRITAELAKKEDRLRDLVHLVAQSKIFLSK